MNIKVRTRSGNLFDIIPYNTDESYIYPTGTRLVGSSLWYNMDIQLRIVSGEWRVVSRYIDRNPFNRIVAGI